MATNTPGTTFSVGGKPLVVRSEVDVKSALPWFASRVAAVLVFTPTYGIGLVVAPLTLIGSWIALSALARASRASRVGAALNVLLVVAGLGLITAVSWPVGSWFIATAWVLAIAISLGASASLSHS